MSDSTLNPRCFVLAAALGAALSGLTESNAQDRGLSVSRPSPEILKQRLVETQEPSQQMAGGILCSGDATNLLYPLDGFFVLVDFFGDGCTGADCAQGTDQHNDDDSATVALPFTFDLYGDPYTDCFVNNNGNLTFGAFFSSFTPVGFPSASFKMVAPFWGDVDTGSPSNFVGDVWMKFVDSNGDMFYDTLVVTWDNVGYFNENGDLLNTFQVAISDGTNPLIGPNGNVAFSYDNMCWTTGDVSGSGGFFGTPATVGANRGNGVDFFQIGRFDHEGTDYDGPFLTTDGVSFLDGQVIVFDTATTTTNIPPIPTNFPPGNLVTVDGGVGEVLDLDLQFLSPELAQTTTVGIVDVNGAQSAGLSITNTPGNVAIVELDWATENADAGTYVLEFTATDNFSPTGVTMINLTIEVLGIIDCNDNEIADDVDILDGTSQDCNGNGIPDECDIADGTSLDCNGNDIPDECELDCNGNGIPDSCDIADGNCMNCTDFNDNGILDACEGVADFDAQALITAAGAPNIVTIGDMDGDGDDDVVTAFPNSNPLLPGSVQVFLNKGTMGGTWQGLMTLNAIMVGVDPTAVAVGDFDGGGNDVAVTNRADDNVTILLNLNGNGVLVVDGTVGVGTSPSGIVAANFNPGQDLFIDIGVSFDTVPPTPNFFVVFNGDGFGSFTPAPLSSELSGFGFGAVSLVTGDFDGNKCPDVSGSGTGGGAINGLTGQVFVFLGNPNGTFDPPAFYPVGLNPVDVTFCDVNQDGCQDIISANFDDNSLSVLLSNCDGTFGTAISIAVGDDPLAVDCADLTADGVPDLAVVAEDAEIGPAVLILRNTFAETAGEVLFDLPVPFSVGADPDFVVIAKLNDDFAFDLVTVNPDQDSVSVLLGAPADIPFEASLDIKPGGCPNPVVLNPHGRVPVALVGRDDFDVTLVDVDPRTLMLSRAAGVGGEIAPVSIASPSDVATPFVDGEQCDCHELEGDGIPDLKMKFRRADMLSVLELDSAPPGSSVELVLSGFLLDGTPFEARDCVLLVPRHGGPGSHSALSVVSNAPDISVQVDTADTYFRTNGVANFDRSYLAGTTVTLTAPGFVDGWVLVGWIYTGSGSTEVLGVGPWLGDTTLEVIIGDGAQTAEAFYVNVGSRRK